MIPNDPASVNHAEAIRIPSNATPMSAVCANFSMRSFLRRFSGTGSDDDGSKGAVVSQKDSALTPVALE
jgi:hypothetical protein